jgi:hypothetical protein
MCMRCELQLFDDHRAAEREFFEPCPECGKIPPSASGNECYHSFGVGDIIDEWSKCNGNSWSEEFLAARQEVEGDEKDTAVLTSWQPDSGPP